MKKILLVACLFSTQLLFSQDTSKDKRMEWWREARFGMFIHWGVYSQWAGVYHGHQQAHGERNGS